LVFGGFKARFVGQGDEPFVECPVGKGFVFCAEARGRILVGENVLEKAGIAAGCRFHSCDAVVPKT